ncbi:MAG: hypothetical protein EAX96_14480 [Candidatus Lokiarchaeota archaeon]|nr:hypothetical protein [Candidatus Lokiarchaeota archaeon]
MEGSPVSYRQEYLSFSAPDLFKKINKMKLEKDSQKMLNIFTESQNIIINNDNEFVNRQTLYNFLSFLSKSFSLKKGQCKEVEPTEIKTALILYYHLTHSQNLQGLIKGDASALYKYSEDDININENVIISTPALNRIETLMERLKNYIPKKSGDFKEQIKSAIMILASILGKDVITRKNIDDSYNLLRILIFRTPLDELEVLGDFFQLLNTDIYKKMNHVKISHHVHNKLKQTVHFEKGRKLSHENIFPNSNLRKIGISKFPIESVIHNLTQIYGIRFGNYTISESDVYNIIDSFEKILLKFDFSYPASFTAFPLCSLDDLYQHAFNFEMTPEAIELLFRIRRSLSAAVSKLVGRNEYVFNYSAQVPRILTTIYTLSSLYTYRMNHRIIDVYQIKQGIKAYYFILKKFEF